MKKRTRTMAWLLAAIAWSARPAQAAEHWFLTEATLPGLAKVWKEGALAAGHEDGHAFATLQTDGGGRPLLAALRPIEPALDARAAHVLVSLRVRGIAHLANLQVRLGSDAFATSWYELSIPIYADRYYNYVQEGTWTPITLSLGEAATAGTPDRGRIDSFAVMATDDGKGRVEVDLAGAALVDSPREGAVSLTFDDGYKEHLTAARMLAERGWRGTAYIIPQVLGTQPAYLTRGDVVEIGRLGSDVAAHDDPPFTDIPAAELEPRVRGIQQQLGELGFAETAKHLAYPLGKQEPTRVRPLIAKLFTTARIAGAGPETIPPADAHLLRTVNVVDTTTPEQIGAWARRAKEQREWLILMFHWLPEHTEKPTDFAMGQFRRALDAIAESGARVAPISEVWREAAPLYEAQQAFPPPSASPAAPAP